MSTITYFSNCSTSEEIKNEYRRLAKLNHPDIGGDTATMQAINLAYTLAMDAAIRSEKPGWTPEGYDHAAAVAEGIREAIDAIIKFDNISIEICGTWVWVSGQTRAIKEALKEAGYKWAPKKDGQPWYFAGTPSRNRKRRYSLDEIRMRYGSDKVENQPASRPVFA
jgi:curved DNA-binding protein CbpA